MMTPEKDFCRSSFLRSDGVLSDMRNLFWQQRTEQYPGCFWRKRTLQFSALLSHRGQSCTYHWRMADQRRSKPENLLEFHSGQRLPELKLDWSASPDRTSPCDLPCGRPRTPASWAGRTSDGWSDKLRPETQDADFSETHNPNNVPIYEHFGFKTYGIVEKPHFDLKQYCMIREATV